MGEDVPDGLVPAVACELGGDFFFFFGREED